MYPFSDSRCFVSNAWYMAAWSSEIDERPLGRKILNMPVALFRRSTGEAAAIWGLCPHRHFPLAEGRVIGDTLQCSYHGFRYDGAGYCVHVPAQRQVPSTPVMRAFPIIERDGLIWIWPGKPEMADASLLPPLADLGIGQPGWQFNANGFTQIHARPQLVIDNLMDLSHTAYLHAQTLSFTAAKEIKATYSAKPPFLAQRFLHDQSADDAYQRATFPDNHGLVDLEITSAFHGPALIVTTQRFHTARSLGEPRYLGTVHHLHGPTPETKNSTIDFSGFVRDCTFNSPALDHFLSHVIHAARVEDVFALEHIERELDTWADARKELAGPGDGSVLRVRRYMQACLDEEVDAELERQQT